MKSMKASLITENSDPINSTNTKEMVLEQYSDPPDGIIGVCSSFEESLQRNPFTFEVPRSAAADHVTLPDSDKPLPELLLNYHQSTASVGLGLKRKEAQAVAKNCAIDGAQNIRKKPKTLSEKRKFLDDDITRYGPMSIEKMYPRQQQPKNNQAVSSSSPIKVMKMKPKPIGLPDYEEVDARTILKPNSHDKYIRDPLYDSVVYIERRGSRSDYNSIAGGLVPLSTLVSQNSTTVLPANCRLLASRSRAMGKPKIFIKDKDGRLLAVGGSRYKHKKNIDDEEWESWENKWADVPLRVYTCPKPPVFKQFVWNESQQPNLTSGSIQNHKNLFVPFEMDAEYANFVASAVSISKVEKAPDHMHSSCEFDLVFKAIKIFCTLIQRIS